jgi:Flp pilus assembly pilin Flp
MALLRWFLNDESGQDLIEYSLLLVFVLIASSIFLQQTGSSIVPVWIAGNATVSNAVAVTQAS